jgi:hypothetical protein
MQSSEQPALDFRIIVNLMSLPTEGKESLPHEICRIAMACCEVEGESIEGNVETVNDHGYIGFRGAAYLSVEHHSFSCF